MIRTAAFTLLGCRADSRRVQYSLEPDWCGRCALSRADTAFMALVLIIMSGGCLALTYLLVPLIGAPPPWASTVAVREGRDPALKS
jgi:hypothetical protein